MSQLSSLFIRGNARARLVDTSVAARGFASRVVAVTSNYDGSVGVGRVHHKYATNNLHWQLPSQLLVGGATTTLQNKNLISTSKISFNNDNGNSKPPLPPPQTLGDLVDADPRLPFRRSKKSDSKSSSSSSSKAMERIHSFDERAKAKLAALTTAKRDADEAKAAFIAAATGEEGDHVTDNITQDLLYDKYNQSEQNLAHAYSQAIKYTSRIPKNETATKMSERLMYEWMERFMIPFDHSAGGWLLQQENHDNNDNDNHNHNQKQLEETSAALHKIYLNKKWMVRTINKIVPRLTSSSEEEEEEEKGSITVTVQDDDHPSGSSTSSSSSMLNSVHIPPPTSKDYINLLRAYSVSKARRKGQQSEILMKNMMKLANTVTHYYYQHENNEDWSKKNDVGMESIMIVNDDETDGKEATKRWKTWVKESIPNSKVFALAIKCHAGTTRPEALERITLLNTIHDSFADCCCQHSSSSSSSSDFPELYKDDPYVLFHSIKSLKNLQIKDQWELGHDMLDRLHNFVTNSNNVGYSLGDGKVIPDVTAAYTTMIRLMARLHGKDGVSAKARGVLDRMHVVQDILVNGMEEDSMQSTTTTAAAVMTTDEYDVEHSKLVDDSAVTYSGKYKLIDMSDLGTTSSNTSTDADYNPKKVASIDINTKAYNLILGLYKDSKNDEDATRAIELLQRMVDAGGKKEAHEGRGGVPLPNEQSFELTILSLVNMSDSDKAIEEAERLIQMMQDQEYLNNVTVDFYNAFIIVCNRQLFGKAELYDKALSILDRMNEGSKINPKVTPTPETVALVMKACSLSEHENHKKVLKTASNLFNQLKEQETDDKSALALSDRAYYNMMKCVDMYLIEEESDNNAGGAKLNMIEELFSEACQRGLCSADVLAFFRKSVSEEEYKLTVGKGRLADNWIANIKGPRALFTDGSSGGAGKNARRKGKSTSNYMKKQKEQNSKRTERKDDKKKKKFFKSRKG